MLRVASGDDEAFAELVGRVLPRLLGYFRRLGADGATAEDCAQEVLRKVYRARENYTPRARFVTYLFHIARNHWIDRYRHRRAGPPTVSAEALRGTDPDGGPAVEFPAPAREPAEAMAGGELLRALERAVGGLGEEQREVFVLARVESLRYAEISEILGIPVGTVKSRMHGAWRQIRESLQRDGIEPP